MLSFGILDPPDSITIAEFMQSERYGRHPISESRNPFTCGITGRTYSVRDFFNRCDLLSQSIAIRLGWSPNDGTPWDKVVAIFSLNSVRSPLRTLLWFPLHGS